MQVLALTAQGKDRNHRRAASGVQQMRKATWWMLSVALAVLVAAPALLAEEAKAPAEGKAKASAKESGDGKEKSGLKGEYAIMASELKLTPEQQTQLAAKLAARDEALAAWKKGNAAKVESAQEALKKAKESGDKEAAKKAGDETKALNAGREKIMNDTTAAIRAILTPEQQQAWDGFTLYRQMMARYRKADLTEDQHKKARELCNAAGKEVAAGKTKGAILETLGKDLEALLTAAQKEAVKPAEKAGAEKKRSTEEKKTAEK
jgi:Spy/CpxP family protein refolding chaperone